MANSRENLTFAALIISKVNRQKKKCFIFCEEKNLFIANRARLKQKWIYLLLRKSHQTFFFCYSWYEKRIFILPMINVWISPWSPRNDLKEKIIKVCEIFVHSWRENFHFTLFSSVSILSRSFWHKYILKRAERVDLKKMQWMKIGKIIARVKLITLLNLRDKFTMCNFIEKMKLCLKVFYELWAINFRAFNINNAFKNLKLSVYRKS